jgi:hypothetical protein
VALKLETKADLEALQNNQVIESSSLEYKASPSIENTDLRKTEISKDVSAMANANGGHIIYGMTEKDHLPTGLDNGISPKPFDGLWFEQIIQQNIRPAIEGLTITPIQSGTGANYFVINVPASKTVHQAKDGRYYRRRNFRNDIMEDYEVREAMNRSAVPEPFVEISLPNVYTEITWPDGDANTHSTPIMITARIGNRSSTPALYTHVTLFLDPELVLTAPGTNSVDDVRTSDGYDLKSLPFPIVVPHHFPLFKEKLFRLGKGTSIAISREHQRGDKVYRIGYEISTPGYATVVTGYLLKRGSQLVISWTPWTLTDNLALPLE